MEKTSTPSFTKRYVALTAIVLVIAILALSGCVMPRRATHQQSSSVLQFLYPNKDQPIVEPHIPTLRLPLRVGIAFAPAATNNRYATNQNFPEARKTELMRTVAAQFKNLPFVQSIEIIPTTYLRPGGGFENLDQLRSLMGIDVIALISYDQAQATNDNEWSFAYWTIIGAYVVPARKNETHTLMEAVVYDISSRNLLFRAPGTSAVKGHSTLAGNTNELSKASAQGYTDAATDLTANLQIELEHFKVRAKEEPESIRIEHKPGYTGGGDLGGIFAGLLGVLMVGRFLSARRK